MARDTYTEVTKQSWGSRLGGAFKGILFGFILIGGALWLLFQNEGRAVRRSKALKEGAGVVLPVSSEWVDPANEGKLVHLSGLATTYDVLRDDTFGVAVNAIHLQRSVEMYQWREHADSTTEKKLGGGTETTTTYSYAKSWSSSAIDSSHFKKPEGHENPGFMPYKAWKTSAQEVSIGSFQMSPGLIGAMTRFQPLPVESLEGLPEELRWKSQLHEGGLYIGYSPSQPEIGDLRISFEAVKPATASVVARQSGERLEPYRTSNGGSIELLSHGAVPAEAMFQAAQKANRVTTWIYRLLGFVLITFGLKRIFRPASVLADVIPALGRAVEAASGFVAYLLAGVIWSVTVAAAWIYHRPFLGVVLLVAAGAFLVFSIIGIARGARRREAAPAAA